MDNLDARTLEFLIHLKAANIYWFSALINAAKYRPRLVKKIIDEAKQVLMYTDLNTDGVNVFQICSAVNKGELDLNIFHAISSQAFQVKQAQIIQQLKEENHI